ncbi:hypothetical protein F2Q68_00025636 [Brassica cretica]|uniref:Apple domain-containing protein n=2 Tax=Brassica cretica TaxID=69181 RepID=A0ABQ7DH23_BRACR|nr:hypothetical protein F2Q68_00025636 [Brassica cretica]KAF3577297.1 hypothetical protein DY000_02031555 [Brassica cretica]
MSGSPKCKCFKGFVPKSSEWKIGNWTDDFYAFVSSMDAEDCYRHCLHNCSYLAFSYIRGIGCLIWNQELMDVTQFYVGGELLSNRLARYELGKSNHKKTIYVVVVSLSFFVILGSSVFGFCRYKVKRNASKSKDVSKDAWRNGLKPQDVPGLNFFEIKSIETATNDFSLSNKLGQGEAARWKRNCCKTAF